MKLPSPVQFPPRTLVVAVDFGEASAQAVRAAGALAARFQARLTAVHAETLEAPPYFTHDQVEKLERQRAQARAQATAYLARVTGELTDVPVESRVTDGPAAEAVLAAARAHDLVVLGTHGRRGPSRWWLGSVAERVARESIAPVLVVRAGDPVALPAAIFRRLLVVVPPDLSRSAADDYARGLADAFGGTVLDRLTVCSEPDARRLDSTLLVIARTGPHAGWIGEAAERLVRTCSLPMLFVPDN